MKDAHHRSAGYYTESSCNIDEFIKLTSQTLDPASVRHACHVEKNVPIYDMVALASNLADPDERRAIMAEWADVMMNSAGVIVLKSAYADTAPID
ncbi:MAG: phytanoyl-CoA dioxygenase, partial [Rhodobacteraceae bacterium]|nr:phytanoyl-CoA dioxygenase [Paracoccaceae bacterium]